MANTVITSTTNSIKVVFNDDSSKVAFDKAIWRKSDIKYMTLTSNHIEIVYGNGMLLVSDRSNARGDLIVDTVNAAGPSSLSDLYDKLIALIE